MNIAAYIAKRIAFNQQRSFSRFVIRLSVGATIISVMVMIVTLAFATGFKSTISQKIFSFWGHIRVQSFDAAMVSIAEETPILRNDSVARLPQQFPQIRKVQAFATRNAILKTTETIEGVLFKGVDVGYDFTNLRNFLLEGRWIQFTDSGYSSEINLSAYTAGKLQLKVNDEVLIYFIQPNAPPRTRKLTVAGIYKTGIEEYDKLIAIGDLKLVQRLNNWSPDQIGGYELILADFRQMDQVNDDIIPYLPLGIQGTTIENIFPNIFDWLALQNKTIYIVLIIMVAIAVLNLITCLLILVLERTRMVGLLKALGARNGTIQRVFLYHGAVITGAGLLFGNILGLLICWLQQRYGFISLPEDAYYISKAAVEVVWWHVALVNAGTFLICFLVLLIPTIIVRKIQPVKAIQFR
ncbi:MAG: ABC transporter permease [Candidatus Pseudobacter hemicellulosilyticus]|uniref:ABC transporter permease n=1 Tax=Candidatus Pseudobacter hemicellulosilyticus TaxID=3121375 RepID=A0AAJ6BDA6_9BACT|nr:MAG: ABC transporter permease [Pseudobacter sp.]